MRAVLGFSIISAAIAHAVATATASLTPKFFADNIAAGGERQLLLLLVMAVFAAAAAMGVVLVARQTAEATKALGWWVRLCSPAVMLPVFLALLRHDFLTEIETALLLALAVIGLERLMRESLAAYAQRPLPAVTVTARPTAIAKVADAVQRLLSSARFTFWLLLSLAAAQGIFLLVWAVWSHQRFGTYGFDLGIYDNIFYSTLHGQPLAVPTMGMPDAWADLRQNHADLATFYLLPLYALRPNATTLLALQAAFISFSAIPLYFFVRRVVSVPMALLLGIAWLLYAPLHSSQMYDYHPQHIGAAWVLCAIASLEYRRYRLYWLFFVLAILCREDVSIGLTALGLYLVLSGHRVKTGFATVGLACLYFVTLRFGLMQNTAFSGMYKNLIVPGEPAGFGSILVTMASNPTYVGKTLLTMEKARYVAQIFAPLAFLPMRRPLLWVLMIPGLFLTLLSTEYLPTIQISFQYVANWAAYMFPAAAIALAAYPATTDGLVKRRAAAVALLFGSLVANYQWGAYSPRLSIRGGFVEVPLQRPSPKDAERETAIGELLAKVPPEARLCTADRIQAHTTALHQSNWPLKSGVGSCQYLLWSEVPGDLGSEHGRAAIAANTAELIEKKADVSLAKVKAATP